MNEKTSEIWVLWRKVGSGAGCYMSRRGDDTASWWAARSMTESEAKGKCVGNNFPGWVPKEFELPPDLPGTVLGQLLGIQGRYDGHVVT